LSAARSTVVLPAYTIGRFGLQKQLERFLAASGFAYATAPMEKALISETHPQFLGMYNGIESAPGVREAVEGADLVLNLGGVIFSDFNTTAWTDAIKPGRMVTVWPDFVEIGDTTFSPIRLADVLDRRRRSTRACNSS
jgi:indolepyruvate decarboxylase